MSYHTKGSTDYAAKFYYSAIDSFNRAVKMESTDITQAIKLYQDAATKFHSTTCQPNATPEMITVSQTKSSECTQRANYLIQFLSQNSPPAPAESPQKGRRQMNKTNSSTTVSTPQPPNLTPNRKLTANDKSKSNINIPAPQNIYQAPSQVQNPTSPQQNIYQTQNQVQSPINLQQNIQQTQNQVQSPINLQQNIHQAQNLVQHPINLQQNIHQTQNLVQSPINLQQNQTQSSTSSQQSLNQTPGNSQNILLTQQIGNLDNYQEGYKYLTNGLLMDNDGFYDLAKFYYSKSVTSFNMFLATQNNSSHTNVQFWNYQLQQRIDKLGFYPSKCQDASSYYFNKSFHIFDEIGKLQNAENEAAEVIQRKLDQYISECISLLKKCIISNQDQSLSKLAQSFLDDKMSSNMKNEDEAGLHSNYVKEYYPDHVDAFASDKIKNDISTAISSKKKFILIYGPSGTKIKKLIQSTAPNQSVKMVYVVNFLKFIGTNENPVDILNSAFEKAKEQTPSYLILDHIEAPLVDNVPDDLSKMVNDFLLSHVPTIPDGVTVFCTSYMPWKIPVPIYGQFQERLYDPAPDVSLIKEILKVNHITKRISDDQLTLIAQQLVGYTEFVIERILIEAQISNAVQSSGGLKSNIFEDICYNGFILRNPITVQDVNQVKAYIFPAVQPEGLNFFDQFADKVKEANM
ncbi:hypothetical protein M9Y10_012006 [Tritrichomonas musculus]|uniref:ATPase AAA-type core domain-containing protein n=1 Tax=Tritrichomonas musculus TaxID=1915356 RepID=A0ABR2IBE9_9EUKA